ncbi:hypothetical protein Emag_007333 [Eimeria magna]
MTFSPPATPGDIPAHGGSPPRRHEVGSAVGYIDDIIVYSDAWDAHRAHLRQLFQALRDANLHLHPGKCFFGAATVRYLGHIVSRDSVKACASKVQAVLEMPAATHQKDLTWTPAADTTWRALCEALSSGPVPAPPDYTRPFYLDCDSSGDGLGAVLSQPYDKRKRVVAYASRSLLDHDLRSTATELEATSIIWALETFRHYIDTMEVCIRTDHAPLEYIRHNSPQGRRLERWGLRLRELRFKVIHRPGAQQKHVDCLSRAPLRPNRTQRPMILDEFSCRTVLHARAEHPAAAAPPQLWRGLLCAAVDHVPHSAHRRMRSLRHGLRHLCPAVPAAGAPPQSASSGSDDDAEVQVCLTDFDDESLTPPTAQLPDNPPSKVLHGG